MIVRRVLALLAIVLIAAAPLAAQTIAGTALGAGSGEAVSAALVVLLHADGRQAGSTMTDADGRFTLRAPAPGRFTIRVERVGYVTTASDLLEIREGVNPVRIAVREEPIQLPALEARSGPRECGRSRDGSDVFALWEEIRKALRLAQEAAGLQLAHFSTLTYARDLNLARTGILKEERELREGAARLPFRSVPPEYLRERGYALPEGDDYLLFGPDEAVLLSDAFVDEHCFSTRRGAAADVIGLAFEPARRRKEVDVRGVLWVDRASAQLRSLEYEYVNLPAPLSFFGAGGEMQFRQLENGLWAVVEWRIRSPRIALRPGRNPRSANRGNFELIGHHEDGGAVLAARSDAGETQLLAGGTLVGSVHDSITGAPLAAATVFLSGTEQHTRSRADGGFEIVGVPPGEYDVAFVHPELAELGVPVRMQRVRIEAGTKATTHLATPALPAVMRAACPAEPPADEPSPSLLFGHVRDASGKPVRAEVRAEWQRGDRDEWRTAPTDPAGRYVLCWLPAGVHVTLRVSAEDAYWQGTRAAGEALARRDFGR